MEARRVTDHPFDLAGMTVGDWFLGCRHCGIQWEKRAGGYPRCSRCDRGLNIYTVTEEDMLANPAAKGDDIPTT